MPDEVDFCFQVDDHFYAPGSVRREYREQHKSLLMIEGKSVEMIIKISKLWSSLPESVSA